MMVEKEKEEKEVVEYKMEIQILEKDKETGKLNFLLKGINEAIANTIRRIIMEEVPCLAIEEVNFIKNSSALYDEFIAHRLGLIPLKTDLKSYTLRQECKCKEKGCSQCQLHFKLKAKDPGIVCADSLKSRDPKAKPVYPKMPIVKLLKNQELEFEATAILGQGKDHSKFSPGLIFYKAYPEIKIGNCKTPEICAAQCPVKILVVENKKIKVINTEKCILCKACEDYCTDKAIKITGSKEDFIFTIESWGQLTPKEMIFEAIDIFDKKLDELNKQINKLK